MPSLGVVTMDNTNKIRSKAATVADFFQSDSRGVSSPANSSSSLLDMIDYRPWENLKNGGKPNKVLDEIEAILPFESESIPTLIEKLPEVPSISDMDVEVRSSKEALTGLLQRYVGILETIEKMKSDANFMLEKGNMKPNEIRTHQMLIALLDERILAAKNGIEVTKFYLRNLKEIEFEEERKAGV